MTTLSIVNHKGGTGKTTTVIHIAAALGMSEYRTLVVDLDPQGFLTRTLGVEEPPENESSLVLFDMNADLRSIPVRKMKDFDLLPSSSTMTKVMRQLNKPTDVFWIKESLECILDYDVVLIDTAAAVTVFSLNALVASKYVLIPVTPEYQPVMGAEQTFQTVKLVQDKLNPDLASPLFLFTQVDARKRSHHDFRSLMRKKYGDHVMKSIIRTNTSLSVTYSDGTTTFDHDPYSRGVRDYANATDELMKLIKLGKPGSNGSEKREANGAPTVVGETDKIQPLVINGQ